MGAYVNTLPVGALVTSNGNNPAAANATLTVAAAVVGAINAISAPTLSEWAMIMLVGLLAIAGFAAIRKQEN